VTDPLFWLVLSFLFVTISLTIVLAVAIPALRELARAARSAEKLFDTLRREFPPTLEAIRLTGMEISNLTDDVSEGVQSAGNVVKQVDQSLSSVRKQAQKVNSGTRSVMAGFKAAWKTFTRPRKSTTQRRSLDRLPPARPDQEIGSSLSSASEPYNNNHRLAAEPIPEQPTASKRNPARSLNEFDAADGQEQANHLNPAPATNPHESRSQEISGDRSQ
jgi:uncharacterized protein YoxC